MGRGSARDILVVRIERTVVAGPVDLDPGEIAAQWVHMPRQKYRKSSGHRRRVGPVPVSKPPGLDGGTPPIGRWPFSCMVNIR